MRFACYSSHPLPPTKDAKYFHFFFFCFALYFKFEFENHESIVLFQNYFFYGGVFIKKKICQWPTFEFVQIFLIFQLFNLSESSVNPFCKQIFFPYEFIPHIKGKRFVLIKNKIYRKVAFCLYCGFFRICKSFLVNFCNN